MPSGPSCLAGIDRIRAPGPVAARQTRTFARRAGLETAAIPQPTERAHAAPVPGAAASSLLKEKGGTHDRLPAEFHRRSIEDRDGFWGEQAELIHWNKKPEQICDFPTRRSSSGSSRR